MRIPRLQTLDSWLAYPNYRLLWFGNFCANSAQWLQLLTVGWLVRDLTADLTSSALLVVTAGAMNTLPGLLIGPWGGVLGDRVDRRRLIMYIQSFMVVFAFAFAMLVRSGQAEVWHAYAYVIVSGACLSVSQPMRQVLIANTVPREALGNAYATNVLTITGTRLVGPFVGGILIANLGFFWNFAVEALLYAAMVAVFLPLKTPYAQTRVATRNSPVADLKEGVRYVWSGNRVILVLIALSLIPNVVLQPVMFLLPVFTDEVLGRGADVGGFLLATNGLGGLIAALGIASIGFIFRRGMVCLITVLLSSAVVVVFAQAQWLPMALVVVALLGFSQSAYRTTASTMIQTMVPDDLRARVTSLQRYGQGFVVVTSLLIGWFAGVTSVSLALTVVGLVGLAGGLAFLLMSPSVRRAP